MNSGGYRLGGYREYPVPDALRDRIGVAWLYKGSATARPAEVSSCRIIPETGVSLCALWSVGDISGVELRLMGPIRSARLYRPEPGECMAGVRVKTEWCRGLLGIDPAEHEDTIEVLPTCLSRRLAGLRDELARRPLPPTIVARLVRAIGRLAENHHPGRSAILAHHVLEEVRVRLASRRPSDGARDPGVSSRHLRRVVRETTGRGAKYFHQVHRLQHAVASAEHEAKPDWGRIALLAGYADQSHLTREFSALAGANPTRLMTERRG